VGGNRREGGSRVLSRSGFRERFRCLKRGLHLALSHSIKWNCESRFEGDELRVVLYIYGRSVQDFEF
jgi:hypothetical protein